MWNPFGLVTCLILAATFVADLLTPLGYSVWVGYLFAVMASRYWGGGRTIWATALAACVLLALDLPLGVPGPLLQGAVNKLGGAVVIAACAAVCWGQHRADRRLRAVVAERGRAEDALRQTEERFRSVVETAADVILCLSPDHRVLAVNREFERVYGIPRGEVLGRDYLELFVPEGVRGAVAADIAKVMRGEPTYGFENPVVARDGTEAVLLWNVNRLADAAGEPVGVVACGQDITSRRRAEQERAELVAELQTALQEIKVLRGLLPICSFCKKVRREDGEWEQLEEYVSARSEARFSHGFCPACGRQHYPEFFPADRTESA